MSTVALVDTGPKITARYYFSHDFIQHHIKSYFSDASGTDSGMWCWTTSKHYFPKESARSGKCNQTGSKNSDGCGCLFLFTPEDKVDPLLFNWKSKLQNRCRQQLGFFFFYSHLYNSRGLVKKRVTYLLLLFSTRKWSWLWCRVFGLGCKREMKQIPCYCSSHGWLKSGWASRFTARFAGHSQPLMLSITILK